MKKILLSILTAALCSVTSYAQLGNFNVGNDAPDFTVTDIHGNIHTLSDYSGKWVVIDLFAYWCGPCAAVSPTINDFYKKYGCNGYDIVVLSIEYEGTHQQTVDFENANGGDASYPTPTASGLAGGGGAVHSAYGPAAYPTIFLVGPDGKIKNEDIWPISGVETFENAITAAGGSAALVVNNCSALEIEELTLTDVTIYPNPSNGTFNLGLTSPNSDVLNIEVFDLIGSKVWEKKDVAIVDGSNQIILSMNELNYGQYILKASTVSGSSIMKAIQIK